MRVILYLRGLVPIAAILSLVVLASCHGAQSVPTPSAVSAVGRSTVLSTSASVIPAAPSPTTASTPNVTAGDRDVTPPPSVTPAAPSPTTISTPNVAAGDRNVAPQSSVMASNGQDTARNAIDERLDTLWSAGAPAPQSFTLTLNRAYLVDEIELVVAQTPAGQTTHAIWLGDPSGKLALYQNLVNTWTAEGQVIAIPIRPARILDRVLIQTDASPSFVAWQEIRVYGQLPGAGTSVGAAASGATPVIVSWPRVSVVGSLDQPTQVTNAGDGTNRLFVTERKGTVRIVEGGVPLSQSFLDIANRVRCCSGEQGLFSIAFPPDFVHKRYFYVDYTSKSGGPGGDVVVARYNLTADANVADPKSEKVILTIPKENEVHNGGQLAFGPRDGYLYVGVGDGGIENDPTNEAQRLDSLKGKILRIDPESGIASYAVPPTNPFVHTPGARPEIWASGLRNPWRFAFDLQTGDLYIGDVGENMYEEVNFQPAASPGGANYGWHTMEGTHCHLAANCDQRGLTFPVQEYTHTEGNCAIIGGQVYRGKAYSDMQGIYFFADLCSGRIWGLRQVGGQWQKNLLVKEPFQITNLGNDEQGNLYITDFTDGTMFRIAEP